MKAIPTALLVALFACLLACGDEPEAWPESIETFGPWPFWGSAGDGVVTAPRWRAPRVFGCEQRVRVRTEPPRTFEPGQGPRKVYGEVVDTTCRPAGTRFRVIEDVRNPLLLGSCESGFRIAASSTVLAALRFASDAACTDFVSRRREAEPNIGGSATVAVTLRLTSLDPPVAELVEITDAADEAPISVVEPTNG